MHNFLPQPYRSKLPGIYAIVNRNNDKIYIGSAANIDSRLRVHRHELSKLHHHSHYLQRAFCNQPNDFYVEVVEEIPNATKVNLIEREQFWMDFYRSSNSKYGYNLSPTAHSCLGYKHTDKARINMRLSKVGKRLSAEVRERMCAAQRLRRMSEPPMTEVQRKAHSLARMGHPCSEEEKSRKREWASGNITKRHRPVFQFTLEGVFIKRFRSVSEAAREMGSCNSNLGQACMGNRRTAHGFVWRYASESSPETLHPIRPRKPGRHGPVGRSKIWPRFICLECGKPYELPPHRKAKAKYCGWTCKQKAGSRAAVLVMRERRNNA